MGNYEGDTLQIYVQVSKALAQQELHAHNQIFEFLTALCWRRVDYFLCVVLGNIVGRQCTES
jgi:hypothetical protein